MGRKRDRFWDYAKQTGGRFECNFCGEDFAGGISRIKSHLSGFKGRDIDICEKVPDPVRAEAQHAIGPPSNKKGKQNVKCSIDDDKEFLIVGDDNNLPTSSSSTALTCSQSKNKAAVDRKLMNFQIANGFFKEHSQTFVEFVKAVSEYGPNYELPYWYTEGSETSAFKDDEILEHEEDVKESWTETGCTLMTIYRTDCNDEGEVKVFAYCAKGALFLTSGPYFTVRDCWVGIIEGIGSHHVVQVIHDPFIWFLEEGNHPLELTIVCPTDRIESILNLITYEGSDNILLAVRMVFIYMRKFSMEVARKIFDKYLEYKMILLFRRTFSDELSLLLSMVEHESQVIQPVVQSLEGTYCSSDLANWVAHVIADTKFWTQGKQLVHIIDVLFQVVRLCRNTKAPGFGYLYEAVNKACDAIDQCCRDGPAKYDRIKSTCHKELREMIKPLHAAASFLNPAIFMSCENFKEDSLMTKGMSYIAHNVIVDKTERNAFLFQVQMYRSRDNIIFNGAAVEKLKTLHPGVWWHQFGGSLPVLRKHAIRILSQPCGLPPEILDTKHRICDSKWMKDILRSSGTHTMEPIDLDEFTRLSEYVNQEVVLTCIPKPTDDTFENVFTDLDPLNFWLGNESRLIRWDMGWMYRSSTWNFSR